MELVYILVLETRFCRFDSYQGYQILLTTGSRSVIGSGPALDAGGIQSPLEVQVLPSRPCAIGEMVITLVRLTRIRGSSP